MDRCKLNFLIDTGLLASGLAVGITGILKLGMHRQLSAVHDIAGVLFVILAAIHIILHFNWITCTAKQMLTKTKGKK